MNEHFRNIHLGSLLKQCVLEKGVEISRICNFFKCTEEEIDRMFMKEDLSTNIVLKWCKLLEYDFFRIYSQHLILYSPPSAVVKSKKTSLPSFRKSIYTKEMIDFIIDQLKTGEKSKMQVMQEYRIPKTTLYKWIKKYKE